MIHADAPYPDGNNAADKPLTPQVMQKVGIIPD